MFGNCKNTNHVCKRVVFYCANKLQGQSSSLNTNCRQFSTVFEERKNFANGNGIVKSLSPDIKPMVGVTVSEFILDRCARWPPKLIASECGITGRKYTYAELIKYSRAFGAALINSGYGAGTTMGVLLPNCPEYALVVLGAWEAGLRVSPINPAYTPDEMKKQLMNSEAQCVVTIEPFVKIMQGAQTENPNLKDIIVIGEPMEGCHTFFEMIKTDVTGVRFCQGKNINTMEEVALLPYSSGTTGPPKGVELTHSNITTNFIQFNQPNISSSKCFDEIGEQERLIGLLPYFHAYGSAAILINGLYQGSRTMTLPRFDPKTFYNAIVQHKPTTLHLVTPLLAYMVNDKSYDKKHFEHVHTILAAAAPIGKSIIDRILSKAGKYIFFQEGYGMTELSPVSHIMNPSFKNTKKGSCGTPVASTQCKIINPETGETLGPHEPGELCVKGPQVMKGYFKNPEATAQTIDPNGWLRTGDVAYYDEDSCFYIVDRLKELIKVKGFQVAPSELEDLLRKHEKITDVAVIGVPSEEHGELPRAYVVKKDESLTSDEINEYMKPLVATFKQLQGGIEFVPQIPKAASGKILRRELSEDYRKKHR